MLDQRARFALSAIVKARHRAAQTIQTSYPKEAQAAALAALGDARSVEGPEELFARRCPEACQDALAARLASPRSVSHQGKITKVETVRGDTIELFHAEDGAYGLVWNTDALRRESSRAFAELDLIKRNAEMYAKQRALE